MKRLVVDAIFQKGKIRRSKTRKVIGYSGVLVTRTSNSWLSQYGHLSERVKIWNQAANLYEGGSKRPWVKAAYFRYSHKFIYKPWLKLRLISTQAIP